jgi:ribosomal protein L37AE/L43A
VEKIRACPLCPNCGSKKFDRIQADETMVKCVRCGKELVI